MVSTLFACQSKLVSLGAIRFQPGIFRVSPWVQDFNLVIQKQTNGQVCIRVRELQTEYYRASFLGSIISDVLQVRFVEVVEPENNQTIFWSVAFSWIERTTRPQYGCLIQVFKVESDMVLGCWITPEMEVIPKSKIKEFNSSQTSPSTSLSINEDALSHVLGPERNGRVRGLGFGVTPSQVGVHMRASKRVEALTNEVVDLKSQVEFLKNLVMQNMASKINENSETHSQHLRDNVNEKRPSPSSQNGSSNVRDCTKVNASEVHMSGDVGRKCKLLNWQKMVVAEAKVASTDPNALVHHVPLGKDVWKVWVIVAVDPKTPLFRPNSDMSLVEDAVGRTVAWHKDFNSFD